ncbi:apoptosis-associated speck-like protein containing a CARD isoform X2 [Dicentrarchus labrax]|uniref:apoptosis-associated speck-like protein containing a CARD isoform X2 n=1 Tax=Dicentrarchus labrax TaxID=13489 RepID=UPI0021F5F8FC|nr:apoptosis-associated speck-like protein containing a CARD isoform X2 [Dicentrarchus labrax]
MPPKTIRTALAEMLEDLSKKDLEKFCHQLLDRREEPRVRRNRVEGKSFLDIVDVLVSTFTERVALQVAVDILTQIDCNEAARALGEETAEYLPKPGSCHTTGPSAGGAGVSNMADGVHFVDKHRVDLINRASNISPILDELLYRKVISAEIYDTIRALRTTQEKMRALLSGPLKASTACKDVFYKVLEENEPYLIDDLKKK